MSSRLNRSPLERGQSLVEMTVGLVILTIIVMGILDLGRVYFTYLTLQDAAGEAALYLAIDPCCKTDEDCDNPNNSKYRAAYSADEGFANAVNAMGDGPDGFDVRVENPLSVGSPISVTIRYPYQPLTPVISAITNSIIIGATASNVVAIPAMSCS